MKSSKLKKKSFTPLHLFSLLGAVAVIVAILLSQEAIQRFSEATYVSTFLVMLIGNATVFFPTPGLVFVYALGKHLNPLYLGLAAALGGTIGEMIGYLIGYSGSGFTTKTKTYHHIKRHVERYGVTAITVFAAIPNPFFDIVGLASGALKIPWKKFILAAFIGILIKTTTIAFAGSLSLAWVQQLLEK